MSKIVAARRSF
jgi:hypothetical protein